MKNAIRSFLFLCLSCLLFNCTSEETPTAEFTFGDEITSTFVMATDDTVTLLNRSQNGISSLWDFGDGQTSTDQNPLLSFEKSGTYQVTLTSTNDQGQSSVVSKFVIVKDRILKYIDLEQIYWEPENENGWPTSTEADVFLRIQQFTDTTINEKFLCVDCPLLFESPVLKNVKHHTETPLRIDVPQMVIIDKELIQFAWKENLNNAYLVTLVARDKEGIEYSLVSNRTGSFGILREDFDTNEFIVQGGLKSAYTLICEYE